MRNRHQTDSGRIRAVVGIMLVGAPSRWHPDTSGMVHRKLDFAAGEVEGVPAFGSLADGGDAWAVGSL